MEDDFWFKVYVIVFIVLILLAWAWKRINELGG